MAEQVGPAPPPIYVGGSSSSDSEEELVRPPRGAVGQPRPKRRRVLCSTEVPAVPVYSNKVNSSFQLCPAELHPEVPTLQWQGGADLDVDEIGPVTPPRPERPHAPRLPQGPCTDWLEEEPQQQQGVVRTVRDESPSPPPQPTRRQRGRTRREVARQLRGLRTWLSAAQRSLREEPPEDDVILVEPPPCPVPRQLQLKVRCRAEIHRVAVEMSQPLHAVVEHMAGRLQVRPEQILLLLRDVELPPSSTPQGLGLGVADIIGSATWPHHLLGLDLWAAASCFPRELCPASPAEPDPGRDAPTLPGRCPHPAWQGQSLNTGAQSGVLVSWARHREPLGSRRGVQVTAQSILLSPEPRQAVGKPLGQVLSIAHSLSDFLPESVPG
nr:NFATC2-interacting protein isoform X1 [Caretta caretta]